MSRNTAQLRSRPVAPVVSRTEASRGVVPVGHARVAAFACLQRDVAGLTRLSSSDSKCRYSSRGDSPLAHPRLEALTRDAIIRAAKHLAPGDIRKWSVVVNGREFPVKQLVREADQHQGRRGPWPANFARSGRSTTRSVA